VPANETKRKHKILVLGLGNEVLGDEGLGLIIVKDLAEKSLFPGVDYNCIYSGGLDILEYISGYDSVYLIDTVCGSKENDGKVRYWSRENFRETLHLSSVHDASFLTTLETGETLGICIPEKIRIIAIEICCDLSLTEKLSDNIKVQFDKIRSEIIKFIQKCEAADPE
jgi:hydrogenase maturation protease